MNGLVQVQNRLLWPVQVQKCPGPVAVTQSILGVELYCAVVVL